MALRGIIVISMTAMVFPLLGRVKGQMTVTQSDIDQWAEILDVRWEVVTNTKEIERFQAALTLTNQGSLAIPFANWSLFLYSVYPMEPDYLQRSGTSYRLPGQGLELTFVKGMLYKMTPTSDFRPLLPGDKRVLRLRMMFWSVSRTDLFPNWFLAGPPSTQPRIVRSTEGEDLGFVAPHVTYAQQKRHDYDEYAARTVQERYDRDHVPFPADTARGRVVPRPYRLTLLDGAVQLTQAWRIYDASADGQLANEVSYLQGTYRVPESVPSVANCDLEAWNLCRRVDHRTTGSNMCPKPPCCCDLHRNLCPGFCDGHSIQGKLSHLSITNASSEPSASVIRLSVGSVTFAGSTSAILANSSDCYRVSVDGSRRLIEVTGAGASGVFYGIQTLLGLLEPNGTVPEVLVLDAPRFRFRGLFLDISRNFRAPEEIQRVMEAMAVYKLNKLHLHLADDEGWRIEIDGLPELTTVGSRRCYEQQEDSCLVPQLGSGPFSNNSGSGFLSKDQYRDILATANRLHIQVIPEIEMPGHARAAIKAMERRYRELSGTNVTEATRYRLIEEGDPSFYTSPQAFDDNAINVCMNSTYNFISKVVQEIWSLHADVQPLEEFHYGGDEVGKGAWVNSSACQQLQLHDSLANQSLKQYFFKRVADITNKLNLSVGGWEDGLMLQGNEPFNRTLAGKADVLANVWDNVWEWRTSSRTYTLANQNYMVVMSHGTHLYFDHPYEPHPEERGYYWATRFTDTQKVFGFMPMAYYDNIEETRAGEPLSRAEVCGDRDVNCPPLLKPENIVGMQGNLWGETVRTFEQAEAQLFPRVLALAERAWHQAEWETETNVTRRLAARRDDWYSFARAVGHRELPRLDQMGVRYRVPPPGAKVERKRLFVATSFPGLTVEYRQEGSDVWMEADGIERIKDDDRLWLRTRSSDGQRYSRVVELYPVPRLPATSQKVLSYMGSSLKVRFDVVDNYLTYGTDFYVARITLNNTGASSIPASNWALYFPSVQWVQDPQLMMEGREFLLQEHKLVLSHVQGYLFRLAPVNGFAPLLNNTSREITFKVQYWSVSKYEQFPNYFVAADGANGVTIKNTATEALDFVGDFARVNQWKRDAADRFDPWTASTRYDREADTHDLGASPVPYLPTPVSFEMDSAKRMSLGSGWVIAAPPQLQDVASYLKDYLAAAGKVNLTVQTTVPTEKFVSLELGPVEVLGVDSQDAYSLTASADQETVKIIGRNATGVVHGVHSLLNMMLQSEDGTTVFSVSARDAPRFPYRGMYLDVARNFHPKASVLKLLEVMGLYKLNKFHIHLADDEGWRLQIPDLEELTQVGSTRCFDPSEDSCLTPVLGSGPTADNPGTGFYTEADYKDILAFAAARHIEVIPEFDMPGHSHAAIKAMQLRRRLRAEAGDASAGQFSLDEAGDQSLYSSIQMFDDNAVNPCLDSTFAFISHVMQEVKRMHSGVNPLKTYHFGGDEVASGAWLKSKACEKLLQKGENLKHVFSRRVTDIAARLGLDVQAWEDGLMNGTSPFPLEDMATQQVFVNAWDNVWEWGSAARAYTLANSGYKVIMSQATHLYFDHPQEPSPEERGFYWATRYTDTKKAFFFQPDDLWANVDITRFGQPLALKDVCGENNVGCPSLLKKENVIGMQGHLWSETIRTTDQMQYMIFPRLLALAERAWRRAEWESPDGAHVKQTDWIKFANALGHAHLAVLDRLNVSYRVPPPGAKSYNNKLVANTQFPGLKVQYKGEGSEWASFNSDSVQVKNGQTVWLRTRSASGTRFSAPVTTQVHFSVVSSGSPAIQHPLRASWACSLVSLVVLVLSYRPQS